MRTATLTLLLWTLACGGDEESLEARVAPASAQRTAPEEPSEGTGEATGEGTGEATGEAVVEPEGEAVPLNPDEAEDLPDEVASRVAPGELVEAAEMMEEAMAAATSAEAGASLCDAAYDGIAAMAVVVRQRFPDRTQAMPPRGLFLDACRRLPENAQQCLLPSYAIEHREECMAAQAALPEADRTRLQNVLTGA